MFANSNGTRLTTSLVVLLALHMHRANAHEVGELGRAEDALKAKQTAKGIKIIKSQVAKNNPRAKWLLGWLYTDGIGLPQSHEKARDLWEQAAAAGDRDAMYALACQLCDGFGGPADRKRALSLFEKSANLGNGSAQFWMGIECVWGQDTQQDYARAVKYFLLDHSSRVGCHLRRLC